MSLPAEIHELVSQPLRRLLDSTPELFLLKEEAVARYERGPVDDGPDADLPLGLTPEQMHQFTFDALIALGRALVLVAEQLDPDG